LLKRGVAVFDELKQGVQDIEFLANPEAGELLIGSGSAFAKGFVLAVIDRLSQRYPRVAYHLMPGVLTTLYDHLRERRIELACSGSPKLDLQEDIDAEVLFEEPLVVAAGAENPWVCRRRVILLILSTSPGHGGRQEPSTMGWPLKPFGRAASLRRARLSTPMR